MAGFQADGSMSTTSFRREASGLGGSPCCLLFPGAHAVKALGGGLQASDLTARLGSQVGGSVVLIIPSCPSTRADR